MEVMLYFLIVTMVLGVTILVFGALGYSLVARNDPTAQNIERAKRWLRWRRYGGLALLPVGVLIIVLARSGA